MAETGRRRVVTGLNAEGQSCVIIDGPVPLSNPMGGLIWHSAAVPADNSGSEDAAIPMSLDLMHGGGTTFQLVTFAPGIGRFMHATDTLDYVVILSGHVVLELEAGEAALGPGDLVVDRGVLHNWRNDGPEPATAIVITIPAHPVGQGRTV